MTTEQEHELKKQQALFQKKLHDTCKLKGTAGAYITCHLCGCHLLLTRLHVFVYPDMTIKALCGTCSANEFVRLDYGNKN